ncbi:hypothetical protein F4803DRAFT_576053 [Xylaria telfairii]|nr:hypothetical protein F4803DRAFT_576053 [Xylaria telfairii]
MEVTHQPQDRRGVGWEQYANCKNMFQFGNLASFGNPTGRNSDKAKHNVIELPMAKTSMLPSYYQPAKPTKISDPALDDSSKVYRHIFGEPSPLCPMPKMPPCIRVDVEVAGDTSRIDSSLDGFYKENLKKLQDGIEPSTMNLAASVIIHIVNESVYQWFNRWSRMDLHDVFNTVGVEGKESELAGKQCNVPPEAIDTCRMTISLAGMYRRCHDVHPMNSGDIQFSKLLKLIDECVIFLGVLKERKQKTLLEKTRLMFQQISVGLKQKKLAILKEVRVDHDELNGLYKDGIGDGEAEYDNLKQRQQAGQLSILDKAIAQLDSHRETSETEILDWLNVLLGSTGKSPPAAADIPEIKLNGSSASYLLS